jgi:hypothetical protein
VIYLCDHLVDSDVTARILRDFIDLLLSEGSGISIREPGD